eukprot:Em0475g1a
MISGMYLGEMVSDGTDLSACKAIFQKLGIDGATDGDCRIVRRVCEAISTRAARLAAMGIVTILRKIGKLDKCTVAIDGTLYEKHPHFRERMISTMEELAPGNTVQLKKSEDGSGLVLQLWQLLRVGYTISTRTETVDLLTLYFTLISIFLVSILCSPIVRSKYMYQFLQVMYFILKQDISILSTSTQHGSCLLKLMNTALLVSSESGARGVDMQTIFKGVAESARSGNILVLQGCSGVTAGTAAADSY